MFALFRSLSPFLDATQIQGHLAGSSPPTPPSTARALIFHREKTFNRFFPRQLAANRESWYTANTLVSSITRDPSK